MSGNDSIPTNVFTRTSNGQLPDVSSPNSNASISQPQASCSPPQNTTGPSPSLDRSSVSSPRDNQVNLMEEGRSEDISHGERKIEEILSCLEGTLEPSAEGNRYEVDDEDRVVDLWHLRHLALSRGGLMSPKLRKRAWPKLVGVDEHILTNTSASLPSMFLNSPNSSSVSLSGAEDEGESTVGLSGEEIKHVKEDICRGVWLVEYHIKMLKLKRENKGTDRSSIPASGGIDALSPLTGFSSRPRRDQHTFLDTQSRSDDTVASPELDRPDQRSNRERGLILNIITGVLRSVPEGEDNSRLHYFKGLDDIAAIFLINLGSPSLASLVMKPLCHLHFRDAMRPNFSTVQNILQAVIMPLLEIVDRRLHDYIIKGGTDDSSVFALSWINTWFAHEILDFEILSRLYDVFLVSHPLFPAYLAVGLLTYPPNRKLIMNTYCEFSALYRIICELPKKMGENKNDSEVVDAFEDCIQLSLCYIRDNPPSKLITFSRKYRGGYMEESLLPVPAIFLLGPPPRWAVSSTAPTDWSLIKLAKKMRDQSSESRLARRRCLRLKHFIEEINLTTDEHKVALIAFGLELNPRSNSRFRISKAGGLVGVTLLIGALYGNEYFRGPTSYSKIWPSASLIKEIGHTLKKTALTSILTDEKAPSEAPPHTDSNPKDEQSILSSDDSSDQKQSNHEESDEDENTSQSTVSPSARKEPGSGPAITNTQNTLNEDPIKGKGDGDKFKQSSTISLEKINSKPLNVAEKIQNNEENVSKVDILQGNEDEEQHLQPSDHSTSATEAVEKIEKELSETEFNSVVLPLDQQTSEVKENIEEHTIEDKLKQVHENEKEHVAILVEEMSSGKHDIPPHESIDTENILAQLKEDQDYTDKAIEDFLQGNDILENISAYLEDIINIHREKDKVPEVVSTDEDSKNDNNDVDSLTSQAETQVKKEKDVDDLNRSSTKILATPKIPDERGQNEIARPIVRKEGFFRTIRKGLVYWLSNDKLIYHN